MAAIGSIGMGRSNNGSNKREAIQQKREAAFQAELKMPMRKRRTREHIIADLSVNHVERWVLRCGWTVERTRYDYGIDLFMETYNSDGEVENGWVRFQLKATDSFRKSADGAVIPVRLEWRDLRVGVAFVGGTDVHMPYFRGNKRFHCSPNGSGTALWVKKTDRQ